MVYFGSPLLYLSSSQQPFILFDVIIELSHLLLEARCLSFLVLHLPLQVPGSEERKQEIEAFLATNSCSHVYFKTSESKHEFYLYRHSTYRKQN